MWPLFDGWCAEHSVDPGALPFDRALNLVYHYAVRNASREKKQEFDRAMAQAVSQAHLHDIAAARRAAVAVEPVPESNAPHRSSKYGLPSVRPAGWGDDVTATQQSLAAANALRVGGKR